LKKIVKLRRQGNSLIVTIPKDLVADLKWKENEYMMLESEIQDPTSIFRGPKMLKVGKID
jgi:antitoxin component of MazEF toxin-antitoxin module